MRMPRIGSLPVFLLSLCAAAAPAGAQGSAAQPSSAFEIGPIVARGNDSDRIQFGVGAFNIDSERNGGDKAAEGSIEYRFGWKLPFLGSFLGPAVGAIANSDGGAHGYAGLYADFAIGKWVISPLAGIGGYHQGDSKDLGGAFSFRLALDAAYEFDSGSRLGLRFAHISNAWLYDNNPGEEELLMTYTVPLSSFGFFR